MRDWINESYQVGKSKFEQGEESDEDEDSFD